MDWKNSLTDLENKSDWKGAIELLDKSGSNELELYLRVMFLLLDLLVEGQYTPEEHDYAAKKLKDYFKLSRELFFDSAEFLFFTGIMIYMSEWYFGFTSVYLGKKMLKKAMQLEPDNILYKWGYYTIINQNTKYKTRLELFLSAQLLFKNTAKLDWLKTKGLLGRYVLGIVEGVYESCKEEVVQGLTI